MKPHDVKQMRSHWESQAADYDWGRKWSRVDTRVLELIDADLGDRLLEIGFGSGVVAAEIIHAYPGIRYYGIDLADNFIRLAKERLTNTAALIQASASHLPFRAGSIHIVLEMNAIHHFPRRIIPDAVTEIADVLKQGGRFISVEDWGTPPEDDRESLVYELQRQRPLVRAGLEYHPSDEEWIATFKNAGLVVKRMEHIPRPLNFQRLWEMLGPEAEGKLARLWELWGHETPTTKMTLFICKKA